jgi:hypothetical protein
MVIKRQQAAGLLGLPKLEEAEAYLESISPTQKNYHADAEEAEGFIDHRGQFEVSCRVRTFDGYYINPEVENCGPMVAIFLSSSSQFSYYYSR